MDLVESKSLVIPPEKRHPWELARIEVAKQVIREYVSLIPGTNVRDIGCGDSFLVSRVALNYPEVNFYAVDTALTPELSQKLSAAWAVRNLAMYRDLLDVIEHIEDDVAFLKYLRSLPFVTDKTTVIIFVPAFQGLFCAHDEYLGHYRRYTNRMRDEHTAQAGYEPLKTAYFFAARCSRASRRCSGKRAKDRAEDDHRPRRMERQPGHRKNPQRRPARRFQIQLAAEQGWCEPVGLVESDDLQAQPDEPTSFAGITPRLA
jgi:hypothetical protein